MIHELDGCRDQATQVVSTGKVPEKAQSQGDNWTGEEKPLKSEKYEVGPSLRPSPAPAHHPTHVPVSRLTPCSSIFPDSILQGRVHCLHPQGLQQTDLALLRQPID